ncbi:hypothetical protein [Acinetobacter sp. GXMZU3951]
MKIAVQIFGHMRTFKKCAPILKQKILEKYDCDVFIHTWNKPYHDDIEVKEDFCSDIIQLYNPKKIEIEEQEFYNDIEGCYIVDTDSKFKGVNALLSGLKYMNYSMISVNLLRMAYQKEYCTEYDYVLCIRPDIYLNDDFDINLFENDFNFNSNTLISFVNYPVLTVALRRLNIVYLASDVFMLMTPNVANRLFKSISDFDKYYIDFTRMFPNKNFHPESAFSELVVSKNIIHRAYIYSFNISRKNSLEDIVVSLEASDKYLAMNNFVGNSSKLKKYKSRLLIIFFILIFSVVFNLYLVFFKF